MKYDPIIRNRLFKATRHESAVRISLEYFYVKAKKIGLPASGSTIGKSALSVRKKTLTASANGFSFTCKSASPKPVTVSAVSAVFVNLPGVLRPP